MHNFLLEPETDIEVGALRMLKCIGRTKPTVPYHELKECESKFHCPWHHRRRK